MLFTFMKYLYFIGHLLSLILLESHSEMDFVDLEMDGDDIPYLTPTHQQPANNITLSSLAYGFFVFKDVRAPACL